MKKLDVKAGIFFGVGMTIFFILQSLLTADSYTAKTITKSILTGLLSGAFSGLFFGLVIGVFKSSKFVNTTTKIETDPNEDILLQTPANHFKGAEGVGGKLYLTNKRLAFKSHKLNVHNHELNINITDLTNVYRHKTLGFINNGLTVTSKNNQVDKFVVEKADEWIKMLT